MIKCYFYNGAFTKGTQGYNDNMKVILYMAITINGYIAKENNDTSFTSDVEWESYRSTAKKIGNLVVGKRTYEISIEANSFEGLEKTKVIVVTNNTSLKTDNPNHLVVGSPREAMALLEKQGFKEALVAGGGVLNGSFMAENLVDEIYLDIEPTIFGRGIKLFGDKGIEF